MVGWQVIIYIYICTKYIYLYPFSDWSDSWNWNIQYWLSILNMEWYSRTHDIKHLQTKCDCSHDWLVVWPYMDHLDFPWARHINRHYDAILSWKYKIEIPKSRPIYQHPSSSWDLKQDSYFDQPIGYPLIIMPATRPKVCLWKEKWREKKEIQENFYVNPLNPDFFSLIFLPQTCPKVKVSDVSCMRQ